MPILILAIIAIVLVVFLFFAVISIFNSLITLRNQVKNSWAQIDVELQRRFDLIPNLVETVKGYMEHEESVLTKVTELRSSWANAQTVTDKANLENELSASLNSIMAVAEKYPDLKANTNFLNLQEELSNTENKLATSRETYNTVTTKYNTKLELFPSNIVASIFKFKPEDLFTVDNEEARKNVKVSF